MTTTATIVARVDDHRETILVGGGLVAVELALLAGYLLTSGTTVLAPRYLLYPFVWVNVGLLAVWRAREGSGARDGRAGRRLLAAGVAVGYGLLLGWLDGTVAAGTATASSARVVWALPPGWGPALLYDGPLVRLSVVPFKLVGYAALSVLIYGLVREAATGRAAVGVVGLFSCVSCTLPVAAALVSGLVGGSVGLTAATARWSYDLSTLAFVLAVTLLWLRPDPSRLLAGVRGAWR